MKPAVIIFIILFVVVCVFFVFVDFGSDAEVQDGVTLDNVSSTLYGLAIENLSSSEVIAIQSAGLSFDSQEIEVFDIRQDERTSDYYVSIMDGDDTVIIIVRDGTNYAFSINGGPIMRCYTNQDSPYCS